MFWELVATVFAGLGAAGLALSARWISRGRLARWWIPVSAGIGMIAFQIYSEYSWFDHQQSLLPAGVEVVRSSEQTAFFRPWSYLFPQTLRFIAADFNSAEVNQMNPELVRLPIYLFERRMSAIGLTLIIHCGQQAQLTERAQLQLPMPGEALSGEWQQLEPESPLLQACH
ncbi:MULTISPECIES: hypothetical protein [Alkalimonas]|uniref:Uncharacterized protein n=1 Tax=Alkalimonas mucilaginosa TaxID=3057676 RepID=A0ABU7JJ22_9GAMM|nr:hypothetical protein [Alkalimonas sp. MEB004]MEE2025694.1 hypothetical protein [Alkalimonas sp. MEB004]